MGGAPVDIVVGPPVVGVCCCGVVAAVVGFVAAGVPEVGLPVVTALVEVVAGDVGVVWWE